MSKVKPILFNTKMVRAILDGKKTVTRRLIKPPCWVEGNENDPMTLIAMRTPPKSQFYREYGTMPYPYEPYRISDILYVRETWCRGSLDYGKEQYYYRADNPAFHCRWHPSIHMPKQAARIWLKVKDVRVERLQDIDGQGVLKEGLNSLVHPKADYFDMNQREMFEDLWNSTIKKSDIERYGWSANPWVWVIEFERCERPREEVTDAGNAKI